MAAKRQKPLDRTGKVTVGKAVIGVWEDRQRPRSFRLGDMRLFEVERVIRGREGIEIPPTDDADLYLKAAAFSLSARFDGIWVQTWAPWADYELDIEPIVEAASKRERMQGADECARMLCVTLEERTRLGLTTIGACNVDTKTRKALAKEARRIRERERIAAKRRAQGQKSRKHYEESSLAAQAPWESEGVSRATWYRKHKRSLTARETSPLQPIYIKEGNTPVSTEGDTLATAHEQTVSEARPDGVRGLVPDGEWSSAPPQKGQANAG